MHWPLTLYYDGACPLCAREIAVLRRRCSVERLVLVDISLADFDPQQAATPPLAVLQARLHARDAAGHWYIGLQATAASWQAAGLRRSAWLLQRRWLQPVLQPLYAAFCRLRPHLGRLPHPQGASRCTEETCTTQSSDHAKTPTRAVHKDHFLQ